LVSDYTTAFRSNMANRPLAIRKKDGENMTVCENCGYTVRDGIKHRTDGDGHCEIVEADTERVIGFTNRKAPKQMYKK